MAKRGKKAEQAPEATVEPTTAKTAKKKAEQAPEEKIETATMATEVSKADGNSASDVEPAEGEASDSSEPVKIPYEKSNSSAKPASSYQKAGADTVTIFSRLQISQRFETPYGPLVIKGTNTSPIHGAPFVTTADSVEKWNYVAKVYGQTKMFRNHIIYVEDSMEDGIAHAKELENEKTGLEQLDPKKPGEEVKTFDPNE